MSVELSEYALLELDEAKRAIGAGEPFGEVDLLICYINGISAMLEKVSGRIFKKRRITETFNGDGGWKRRVRHAPVYTESPDAPEIIVAEGGTAIASTAYKVDAETGLFYLDGYTWEGGIQNCSIEYTAGYDAVPEEVKAAAIITLAKFWRRKDNATDAVGSVSVEGQTIFFRPEAIPPEALALLPIRPRFA